MNYFVLQERMKVALADAFDVTASGRDLRRTLAKRAQSVLFAVTEPRLRAFCNRLIDTELPDPEWLESVCSQITGVPPARWTDTDVERYHVELSQLCERFRRVESIAFQMQTDNVNDSALRVVITRVDGSEIDQVVHYKAEEDDTAVEVEARVSAILRDAKAAGFAGALRAFWKALDQKGSANA